MSHVEVLPGGQKIRKRDVVDDLKEFIARYEFYDDEVHRLWNDYEELEAENERLKERNKSLSLALGEVTWRELWRSAMFKRNRRKYLARGYQGG